LLYLKKKEKKKGERMKTKFLIRLIHINQFFSLSLEKRLPIIAPHKMFPKEGQFLNLFELEFKVLHALSEKGVMIIFLIVLLLFSFI